MHVELVNLTTTTKKFFLLYNLFSWKKGAKKQQQQKKRLFLGAQKNSGNEPAIANYPLQQLANNGKQFDFPKVKMNSLLEKKNLIVFEVEATF